MMFIAKNTRGNTDPLSSADPLTGEPDSAATDWLAPTWHDPLGATVHLPGSKSLTNRELILAALANGESTLVAPLKSRDSELMIAGLKSLGVAFSEETDPVSGVLEVRVTPPAELTGSTSVHCGLAGTVMRFLPPVAALALGPTAFDGDPYARKRPMAPIIAALQELGVDISDDGRGALPFTVHGFGEVAGGSIEIDASSSSQFVSGLLLAAARFRDGITVTHRGESLPSLPHIEMTLQVLAEHGVTASSPAPGKWTVEPSKIAARRVVIEPDLSNAAPFLAAALVCGGSVSIPNWPAETTQVGDQLRKIMPEFGAEVSLENGTLTVSGSGEIRPVNLHLSHAGELAPTLIGLAALADGTSKITGIGHIRHHETDRIAALVTELNRLGGNASELPDGIQIDPAQLHGGTWQSYADHRMATTGALLGLRVPDVTVQDIGCTTKTLPNFTELWGQLLQAPSNSGVGGSTPQSTVGPGSLPAIFGV